MKHNANFIKYTLATFFISIFIFICYKINVNTENNRKLEARFDRFAEYLYPHLKEMSDASSKFSRMHVSVMYDYLKYKKGRYISETVRYYDGGVFSMKEYSNIEFFLSNSGKYFMYKVMLPINSAPKTRYKERNAIWSIIRSVSALSEIDIYIDELNEYEASIRIKEKIDSLTLDVHGNLYSLDKYRTSRPKINLGEIDDYDYDLSNY